MAGYCISCLLRNPFPWLAALGCLLAFSHSQGFGFLTIFLTSSAVILCPVLLCRCKQKHACQEGSIRPSSTADSDSSLADSLSPANQSLCKDHENKTAEEIYAAKIDGEEVPKLKNQQQKEEQEQEEKEEVEERAGNEYMGRSSAEAEVLLSDSESVDHTTSSEDYSENDSMFRENLSHSTNYSDGSISDEESLIEIVLPTGHYVDSKRSQEPSWYGFQQKWPDCSLQSHFRQQNWMEMQNEMNDENFIEIDLCMGSIKCSRFEIQA